MGRVELFGLATRGVNIVEAPTHLSVEEVTSAQNVEVVSDAGENALDQRPGMSKVNAVALSGTVAMAQDVPSDVLLTKTPTLYSGYLAGAGGVTWRKSTDGTTWSDVSTPVAVFADSGATNTAGYFKFYPKVVTVKGLMYYFGGVSIPLTLHQFDGVTDKVVSTVPPAVSGVSLATIGVYPTDPLGLYTDSRGPGGATSYSYKFVSISSGGHGAASAVATVLNPNAATLSGSNFMAVFTAGGQPPAGVTSVDVYRTAGGLTQGKIGTIAVVAGNYTVGNGSGILGSTYVFTDAGLVGDGTTAPATASGTSVGDALAITDVITDGSAIYVAVMDLAGADPVVYGRILKYTPGSNTWTQMGANFPNASGNGCPGALAFYGGTLSYATYAGTTAGNTTYVNNIGLPLPAGGVQEVHTTAASQTTACMAVFNGDLYVGYVHMGATAAVTVKRLPIATWSTSATSPTSLAQNGWVSLKVFNGRLFAGWQSGTGATAAKVYSTIDGVTWVLELTTALAHVPGQFVLFNNNLYVAMWGFGSAGRVYQRDAAGTWTLVDTTSAFGSGALGVVYA